MLSLAVKRILPDDTDTTPVFRYVLVQPRKRALVLDTSGSMTVSSSCISSSCCDSGTIRHSRRRRRSWRRRGRQ